MKYCHECGYKNSDNHSYCKNCGTVLDQSGTKEKLGYEPQIQQPEAPNLVRRNYLIWWLLSLAVSPFYFVYLYFNFEDMKNLEKARPPKEGPSLMVEENKLILYMVLSLFIPFFIFIVRHWKYDKFYNYLKHQPEKQKNMPISGKKHLSLIVWMCVLLLLMATFFSLVAVPAIFGLFWLFGLFIGLGVLCSIGIIIIGVYFIIVDYRWQEAMNERILIINPNAEEKLLF